MPLASRTAAVPYNPDNYVLPSQVSAWFAPFDVDGTLCEFRELGNVAEISAELTEEYLDHESFRKGIITIDRSLINKVTGSITLTMDEVVKNNIDIIFKPATSVAGSSGDNFKIFEQVTVQLGAADVQLDLTDGTQDFNLTLDFQAATVFEITDRDGTVRTFDDITNNSTTAEFEVDNTAVPGAAPKVSINGAAAGFAALENKLYVITYFVTRPGVAHSIQDGITLEGALRIQMLSNSGPQGVFIFNKVVAKMAGAIALNPTDFFKAAMEFTILTSPDGTRGTYTQFDTFPSFTVGVCN